MNDEWFRPVQPEKAKQPWNEVLIWLNKHPWCQSLVLLNQQKKLNGLPTSNELYLLAPQIEMWMTAMCWVYKKTWDDKYKIPGSRKLAKLSEPLGDLFISYRELCKECLFLLPENETKYPNAAIWFCAIVYEDLCRRLENALFCATQNGRPKITKPQAIADTREEILAPLKSSEKLNPIDPGEKHLHCLIEYANEFAETSAPFQRKYYQPYIKALEKLVKFIETNSEFTVPWVEDDKIFVQNGRGRGKLLIQPDAEILKKLQEVGFTT